MYVTACLPLVVANSPVCDVCVVLLCVSSDRVHQRRPCCLVAMTTAPVTMTTIFRCAVTTAEPSSPPATRAVWSLSAG